MKSRWKLVLGVVALATFLFAENTEDYDHTVDFGKYHTYSWIGVNVQEPLWNARVTKAIDDELTSKGWRKVDSGGDASISAVGSSHIEQTLESWYSGGFGGGWGHRGWWAAGGSAFPSRIVDRTLTGTLHIDIFDSQSKKVIWHGVCTDSLTTSPDNNEKKLEKAVAGVFKKFPPRSKG